jgi:hypothetical protein
MGFLERIKKGEREKVLQIIDDGREFLLTDMTKTGEILSDKLKNTDIAIVTDSVNLKVTSPIKPGKYHMYLADPSVGATIELKRDESILKTRTNANLIGTVVSSRLLQQAFAIKPSIGSLLLIGILGLIMGAAIGKIF